MTSVPFFIVVDDTDTSSISYGPVDWNISTLVPWFNGTGHVSAFATNGSQFGTISMEFEGTSVAFFGITPPVNSSQTLIVSIDGSEPFNTSYNDPSPPSYRQWYQSPNLTEGSHQITLSNLTGTSLDFAIVTVGNNTPLAGQVAIVDNDDPSITFEGNWQRSEQSSNSTQFANGLPFHNSTQDSTTVGDSLIFRFNGIAVDIYGTFTWSNLGSITLTFSIDGVPTSKIFPVTSTTPQFQTQFGQQQNFKFFSYDVLDSGDHTFVVNVTDCVNQTFSVDYITFVPAFSTLATMPNLTSPSSTGASNLSPSHRNLSIGAIIGIVVAVIIVFASVFLGSRLRKKTSKDEHVYPFLPARRDTGTFTLGNRSSSASPNARSNGMMHISNYNPLRIEDPDGPNTAVHPLDPPQNTEQYNNETLPPSYDESMRMSTAR